MAGNQKIITDLIFNIAASTAELRAGLNTANNQISGFANKVKGLATTFGIAFGVSEVLNFGLEVSKLAGEAEGVENAFKKIAGSTALLEDMKRATQGTVSELELMKRAVQFSNFGLDLGQLPKLLEFATKRAQQTGQSVDYLVDSIVTGLGRKSVLILDNLGISSQQLNSEIAKTGDFFKSVGTIVDQSLAQMGDSIENNLTKTQRLSASWENFKVSIGKAANETGVLGSAIDGLSVSLDVASSSNLSFWQKVMSFAGGSTGILAGKLADLAKQNAKVSEEQKKQAQITREVDRAFVEFGGDIQKYAAVIQTHIYRQELLAEFTKRLTDEEAKRAKGIENITNLQARQSELQQLQLLQTGAQLSATNRELQQIDEKIKKLKELGIAEEQLHNITKIPDTIQKYLDDRKTANSGAKKASFGSGVGGTQDSNNLAKKNFQELNDLIDEQDGKVIKLQGSYSNMGATMDDALANIGVDAVESLGNSFAGMADSSKNAFQNMVGSILGSIRSLLIGLFAKALAGVISGAATSGPPPVALALAAIGVAGITAMWNKIPAFAAGGNYSGGMALVGERGPELINFNKGGYINNASDTARLFGSGGGLDITINGMVRGEDIYYSLSEVRRKRGLI